jgi:hypothetical protein
MIKGFAVLPQEDPAGNSIKIPGLSNKRGGREI